MLVTLLLLSGTAEAAINLSLCMWCRGNEFWYWGGRESTERREGKHNLLWRDLKSIMLEKMAEKGKSNKNKITTLKRMRMDEIYWDMFCAQGWIWTLETGCMVKKTCTLSHNRTQQTHQVFCLGKGHSNVPSLSKTHTITTLKNHNYFRASQVFPRVLSTFFVAADLLSGFLGEISSPK